MLIKFSKWFLILIVCVSILLSPFVGNAQNLLGQNNFRFNAAGALDLTFRPNFPESPNARVIVVQPDGKILVCGVFSNVNGIGFQGIVRLNPDGSIDNTFSSVTVSPAIDIHTMALLSDGRILIGGLFSAINGVPRTGIARLNSDGSLDPSLGPVFSDWRGEIVTSISPLSNGQIIIAGQLGYMYTVNGMQHQRTGVLRLNSNGSVDLSFGVDDAFTSTVETTAVQSDGRVIVGGGFTRLVGQQVRNLGRLNADGTLDTSFAGTADSIVWSLEIQDDGKIVMGGGFSTVNGANRRGIARLGADGALDSLFNPGTGIGGGATRIVKIQPDGKILIGGNFPSFNGVARAAVARLNSDGSLDNGVNPILTRTDAGTVFVLALDVQNDGRVLIGATFNYVNGLAQNAVARLASNISFDFDSDKLADVSIWNPTNHNWYILNSMTNITRVQLDWGNGSLGDIAVPADYDGDGQTDIAVYRPSEGNFYVIRSQTNAPAVRNWGSGSDIPVPADYDGDGKADYAVFRPSEGTWYIINSATNTVSLRGWGASGDKPVAADYDGDGKADIAVFRPSEGNWYIINSSNNTVTQRNWGTSTDKLVPADYDGDGKADIAVWRGSEGNWYIINSSNNTVTVRSWGASSLGDIPVLADYDGDGKTDIAVWRPSEGNWYIIKSGSNSGSVQTLGQSGDVPIPSVYIQ